MVEIGGRTDDDTRVYFCGAGAGNRVLSRACARRGVRFVGSRPGSGSARAILCGLCAPPPAAMCRRLPGAGGYAAAQLR